MRPRRKPVLRSLTPSPELAVALTARPNPRASSRGDLSNETRRQLFAVGYVEAEKREGTAQRQVVFIDGV